MLLKPWEVCEQPRGRSNQVVPCNCVMFGRCYSTQASAREDTLGGTIKLFTLLMASELMAVSQENNTNFALDNLMKMSVVIKERSTLLRCFNRGILEFTGRTEILQG